MTDPTHTTVTETTPLAFTPDEPDADAPESAVDGPQAAETPAEAPDATLTSEEPLEGHWDAEGEGSPYFAKVWRGVAVYQCPECPFPGVSHAAVVRHIAKAHPAPAVTTAEDRAAASGIILATR